jgi:GT2 family glycosyltransferase
MRADILEAELTRLFPKISIIIVTYNNLEYTKMCLESIFKNTEYPSYEIILVDNGSSDGTVMFLEDYKSNHNNIFVLKNSSNLGFAVANNLGVNASIGDTLVFLNNDTLVTPGWLHCLLYHLENNPNAGMVGPVTNGIGNEARIDIDYTDLEDINGFAARRAQRFSGVSFEIRVLALYCSMISRSLFLSLGGLDERYQVGMFEDDDLALKIQHAGLKLLCAEDVFIHHFHKISFNQFTDQEFHRIFQENKINLNRNGVLPGIHTRIDPEILDLSSNKQNKDRNKNYWLVPS